MPQEQLLDYAQVGKILGLNYRGAKHLVDSSALPHVRVNGRKKRVPRSAVLQYIKANTVLAPDVEPEDAVDAYKPPVAPDPAGSPDVAPKATRKPRPYSPPAAAPCPTTQPQTPAPGSTADPQEEAGPQP